MGSASPARCLLPPIATVPAVPTILLKEYMSIFCVRITINELLIAA